MATIRPFKAFRPQPQYAAQVAAKPYDVLSTEEARAEASGTPLSFLHVTKPEIDLPASIDPHDDRVYEKGKENLRRLITDGILEEDDRPCFYLYAQTMGHHTQYGIAGCVSVEEYMKNAIKKHELTRKDKEDDRTKHVRVTNAQTGPIFLMHRTQPHLHAITERIRRMDPMNDFVADDGVRHQLWVINDQATVSEITEAFRTVQTLYVADGHHRAAAAARVGQELAAGNPKHTGSEEYNFFLAVLFPHSQLHILDYNRIVKDLNGRTVEALLRHIEQSFAIRKAATQVRPSKKGEYGMYVQGRWYALTASEKLLANTDPVERLDVSILQENLLGPLLGIDDPRISKRIDFVGGIRGLRELERRVDSGEMAVAFALYPTSIEELLAIADAGKTMPPKSTWFEPKLRDGLLVHFLL